MIWGPVLHPFTIPGSVSPPPHGIPLLTPKGKVHLDPGYRNERAGCLGKSHTGSTNPSQLVTPLGTQETGYIHDTCSEHNSSAPCLSFPSTKRTGNDVRMGSTACVLNLGGARMTEQDLHAPHLSSLFYFGFGITLGSAPGLLRHPVVQDRSWGFSLGLVSVEGVPGSGTSILYLGTRDG